MIIEIAERLRMKSWKSLINKLCRKQTAGEISKQK